MKRIFTVTLPSLLFLLGLPCQGFSALTFSLDPAVSLHEQGDVFCLDVRVVDFNDIISMQFGIVYDESLLEFENVQNFNLPLFSGVGNEFFNTNYEGAVLFSWISDDINDGTTMPDGESLFQLCFKVIASEGNASIYFTGDPVPVEVVQKGDVFPTPVLEGASVIIGSGTGLQMPEEVFFFLPELSAQQNDQICMDLVVANFTNVVSVQFSINYDADLLNYVGSQGYQLPNLASSNIANPNLGDISVAWIADDVVNGTTVPDSTSIFQLCFDVLESEGTALLSFSANPVAVEVSASSGTLVNPVFDGGAVYIGVGVGTQSLENVMFNYLPFSPNPMTDVSYLSFELHQSMDVQWRVLSMDGSVIMEDGAYLPFGKHQVLLRRASFPSAGTYVVELIAGGYQGVRTLVLVR